MKDNKECCSSEELKNDQGNCCGHSSGHGHKHNSCACGGSVPMIFRLILIIILMSGLVFIGYSLGLNN